MDPIGRVVVLEDTNHDGTMDKRTVFADGLILARAVKVLDHGVLVGEPPNVWLMHDTDGDLRMDTKELVTAAYGRREGRVEQNASDLHWGLDNCDPHGRQRHLPPLAGTAGSRSQPTLSRGEWGVTHDDAGRIYRNTNESSLHVDFVPTPYFARNPNLLRTRGSYEPPRSGRGDQRGLAGAAESRHQPRLSDRHRSPGRHAREVHVGLRAAGLPRRSPAGRCLRQRVRRRARRQRRQPDHPERRRHDAAGEEGLRARRVPGVDRRAVPARLPLERPRRHALHRRHVSRRDPAARGHHPVPARPHRDQQARAADRSRTHLSRGARQDAAGHGATVGEAHVGAARRRAGASERLVARHGAAAAGRARRPAGRSAADRRSRATRRTGGRACTRSGRSTASTASIRPIDDPRARRSIARRARRRDPDRRAVAAGRQSASPGGGAQAAGRHRIGPSGSSWRRRLARCRPLRRGRRSSRCSSGTATIPLRWTRR